MNQEPDKGLSEKADPVPLEKADPTLNIIVQVKNSFLTNSSVLILNMTSFFKFLQKNTKIRHFWSQI